MILVNNHQVDIPDFEGNGKSKYEQLDYRDDKDDREHGPVPENLPEFFL
jgi:hypothetical protein